MKKCKMCGSFMSDNAKVCPRCGIEVKEDVEPIKVEPTRGEENISPVSYETKKEEFNTGANFCPSCGSKLTSDARFCPRCGKSLVSETPKETPRVEIIDSSSNSTNEAFELELNAIREDYSKKGTTNLVISIVSLILCCCGLVALIPFIGSIRSLNKMKNFSQEVKNTAEYRSVRNKHVIALIISSIVIAYFAINMIDLVVNFEEYVEIYNSAYQDALNGNI